MYLPYALAMSRQDELQRTAATYRLAAQAPKARVKRRPRVIAPRYDAWYACAVQAPSLLINAERTPWTR